MRNSKRRIGVQVATLFVLGGAAVLSATPGAEAFGNPQLGSPLPFLNHDLQAKFLSGQVAFQHNFTPAEGLGPVFNDTSCQNCHGQAGGVVGGGDTTGVASTHDVTQIGFDNQGYYDPLRYLGGPLLEINSIASDGVSCSLAGETVPSKANIISIRHTPPVFGFGLIDAIPDYEILSRENLGVDGVRGIANWGSEMQGLDTPTANFPPDQLFGSPRVGRFGWKSQTPTLQQFAAEPFNTELGVSSAFFPQEHSPTGIKAPSALPAGCEVATTEPNDLNATTAFDLYHFQALLAPPPRGPTTRESLAGEAGFFAIGCATCHVPQMQTGPVYHMLNADGTDVRVPQLENQTVHAYSDFLIHDMGPTLADNNGTTVGRVMGRARGFHWRTTPLWGFRFKDAYLHDGRTDDAKAAILAHGGESTNSVTRFSHLSSREQDDIVAFINTL